MLPELPPEVLPELPPEVLPELPPDVPPELPPDVPLELAFALPPDVLPEPPLETEPPLEVPPVSLAPLLPLVAPLPLEVGPTEPDADPPSFVVWVFPEVEVPHAVVNANAIASVAPPVLYARTWPFIYVLQRMLKSGDRTRQSRAVGPPAALVYHGVSWEAILVRTAWHGNRRRYPGVANTGTSKQCVSGTPRHLTRAGVELLRNVRTAES